MRYLFKDSNKIFKEAKGKYLSLFLDCDGTLAPIVDTPDKAVIPRRTKDLIIALSRKNNCSVAVISGRSLADIKKKCGIRGIIYSGNHGFQISGPKLRFTRSLAASYKKILRGIKSILKQRLSGIKGVLIEDKGVCLALHFRLASRDSLPFINSVFRQATAFFTAENKIIVKAGKKVMEVAPADGWGKGKIVLWIMAKQRSALKEKKIMPVYIGDDLTDEDAFKALKGRGVTIFVGKPGSSGADYYLRGTREVAKFLRLISGLK
jgi:trehalose-phosphatase